MFRGSGSSAKQGAQNGSGVGRAVRLNRLVESRFGNVIEGKLGGRCEDRMGSVVEKCG